MEEEQTKEFPLAERVFHLKAHDTTVKTEFIAGLTTFFSVAYIIILCPNIISLTGMPKEAAIAATIWASAISTLLIGIIANYPVALAPGVGSISLFTFYIVGVLGLPWKTALGAVFITGVIFLLLTISGARQAIVHGIPLSLKRAISVGIGFFITFLGLKSAGIIVADKATIIGLGNLASPAVIISLIGFLATAALMAKGVSGAIIIGIFFTMIIGVCFGISSMPKGIEEIVSLSFPSVADTFGMLDITGVFGFGVLTIIFNLTMLDLFDTIGTLIAVMNKANMMDEDGHIPRLDRAMTADSLGTIIGSVFGTPTITSYIESATGVAAGGRTGFTAVVVAACFMLSLVFAPLIAHVPSFATAPALILIGALMMPSITKIDFDDITEAVPAFLTIFMMPLTSSIGIGFAFGFISYVILRIFTGRAGELSLTMWIISAAFLVNLIMR